MQSLEASCEEGERTRKKLKTSHLFVTQHQAVDKTQGCSSSSSSFASKTSFCITNKLKQLYEEEAKKSNRSCIGLKTDSFLLEKLVAKERLNTLILNLYAESKGYSLMSFSRTDQSIKDTATKIEVQDWCFDEAMLLSYIDIEQLPPFLIRTLQTNYSFLFYSGCVIAEIRNYRSTFPNKECRVHHVLLRPTQASILANIELLTSDQESWGLDERSVLESHMLKARVPKLCLSTDKSLCKRHLQINHNRRLLHCEKLRRKAKMSTLAQIRSKNLQQSIPKPGLELFSIIVNKKLRETAQPSGVISVSSVKKLYEKIKVLPVPPKTYGLDLPMLAPPHGGIIIPQFRAEKEPEETSDCLPQLVEEYILETDILLNNGNKRLYHIKLSILQRPSNLEFLGELYLEWDHKQSSDQNGVACRFPLGTKAHANKYIQQFTDIFTDNFRKRVKIKHRSYKEKIATQIQTAQSSNVSQINLAQQHLQQLSQSHACLAPLLNGTIESGINVMQQNSMGSSAQNILSLQPQLQANVRPKPTQQQTTEEMEINALADDFRNYSQQFQVAASAKQQQQRLASENTPSALINPIVNLPATSVDGEATSVAVVNALGNTSLLQQMALNQKLLPRKMTLSNVANARVINHSNLIAVNNNRVNVSDFNVTHLNQSQQQQQQQTITLNSSENLGNYASFEQAQSPVHFIRSGKSGQQFVVQSPKGNPTVSPLSSPPSATVNVQGLNFTPIQNISGLQNVQVQYPGFAQSISLPLNVSSTGGIQGHSGSLLVSLPVTTATPTCSAATQQATNNSVTVGTINVAQPTVVFCNTGSNNLAQLVGVKGLSQQNLRTVGPTSVTLAQAGQQFQLLAPLQRPKLQQASVQQGITARSIQRTPMTIKMASPNTTAAQVTLPSNASSQLQKQAQVLQQVYYGQQQKNSTGKGRRRSNTSDMQ